MKINALLSCILVIIPNCLFAQRGYNDEVNLYNVNGQKEGYWIEDRGVDLTETYYKNGKKNGIFKSYSKTEPSTLLFFGEFANDQLVGTWYTFGDKGHILQIDTDFGELSDTIRLQGNIVYYSPNTCHTQFFAPGGWLKSEGMLLWGDSPEADGQEYGEWKYYNKDGKLVEIKNYD